MAASYFISDLHLAEERPESTDQFLSFLEDTADNAERLFVLGDLFEYWIGDETLSESMPATVVSALRSVANGDTEVFLIHGNRDFLIGERFATAAGLKLLPDPYMITLYGTPTLLMHGDTLCTDDVDYLKFRETVRNAQWQQEFLARSVAERKHIAESARNESRLAKQVKSMEIMDASASTVEQTLRQYDYPRLIHGHTHRPAKHKHLVDGHSCERFVLADWYKGGSYLVCDASGCRSIAIE